MFETRLFCCVNRSRSSSHICGGTTGGSVIFRSSPVSSCCGSQGRSSPETMEHEMYGAKFDAATSTYMISSSIRNGAMPLAYGPICLGQTPGTHSLFLCLNYTLLFYFYICNSSIFPPAPYYEHFSLILCGSFTKRKINLILQTFSHNLYQYTKSLCVSPKIRTFP